MEITGAHAQLTLPDADERDGLRAVHVRSASIRGAEVVLDDMHLTVESSAFEGCHFRQRVRPVLNAQGFAAQGWFGSSGASSTYRDCTFERVRFKLLGGFSLGAATYEDCTFLDCRWEGHFAHDAQLIGNRFAGRMNGCVWFGRGGRGPLGPVNTIRDNDFTRTRFTTNVGWRKDFPVDDQLWPEDYRPSS